MYSTVFLRAMTDELEKLAYEAPANIAEAQYVPVATGMLGASLASAPYLMGNLNAANFRKALPALPVGAMGYLLGSRAGKGLKERMVGDGSGKGMSAMIGGMAGGGITGVLGGKGKHIALATALGALAPTMLAKRDKRR